MKITILNGNFQYIYLTKLKYWPYGTISIGCGAAWAFNECLVWKSQLHSAQVPLPINSARPCGMGAGRRFCGALWIHGGQCPELISLILWSVCVVNMCQFDLSL